MKKQKPEGNLYPPGLYKRGSSWIMQFVFKGRRHVETIGCVSLTVAKEKVRDAKTHVAEGTLAIDGMVWKGRQWVEEPKPEVIDDRTFNDACEEYLKWYKANRGAYTYRKYASTASKALKKFFGSYRLSQI